MMSLSTAPKSAIFVRTQDGSSAHNSPSSASPNPLFKTPLVPELELRGRVRQRTARKVVVDVTLAAEGTITAEGVVVAVRMPDGMVPR